LCGFQHGCELLIRIILSKVNYYSELPYQFEKLAISEVILLFQKDKVNFPHRVNNTNLIINPLFINEIKNKNEQNIRNLLNRYIKDEELIKMKEFRNDDDYNEWQKQKNQCEKEIVDYLEKKIEFVIKFDDKLLDDYSDLFNKYQNDLKKDKNKRLFDQKPETQPYPTTRSQRYGQSETTVGLLPSLSSYPYDIHE